MILIPRPQQLRFLIGALLLAIAVLSSPGQNSPGSNFASQNSAASNDQIREACIKGRRLICGKIIQIVPEGLVVESGYTNLVRHPLTQSWMAPGVVSASRNPKTVEGGEPGSISVGLVFLIDTPKSPPVKPFDYVMIQAYPAGQYSYTPIPTVTNAIRKFSAGLETAIRLNSAALKTNSLPAANLGR